MSENTAGGRDHASPERAVAGAEPAAVEELVGDLEALADDVGSPDADAAVDETTALLELAHERGLVDSDVRHLGPRDAAEALVGSVIFASPLLVEDGVFEIADHLFGATVSGVPVFLVANTAFVVLMTYALLEWTGRDREEASRLLGVVPTRVVMVLAVSFAVAAVTMTVWGRLPWETPIEAIARVNVLWTVGSIGAALGDIVSEGGPQSATGREHGERSARAEGAVVAPAGDGGDAPADTREPESTDGRSDGQSTDVSDGESNDQVDDGEVLARLYEQFETLHAVLDGREERREVRRIRARTSEAAVDGVFGDRIRKYTTRDVAEAFVGSVIFAIPLLVEDGVFDVADYFLAFRVGAFPLFFLLNAAFVLGMVAALVYWAGPQDVQVSRPLFGFLPRRLVGIAVVSFLTAAALMTMWGRVDGWSDPVVAVARISAVWTVASFGAALGDILPGESSGDDINDDLAELGDRVGKPR